MRKRGPVLISDLKKSKKVVRRNKRIEAIDARKAYSFTNKKEKSRAVHALGKISRRIALVASRYEARVAASVPFRIGAHCLKHPLTRVATRKVKKIVDNYKKRLSRRSS